MEQIGHVAGNGNAKQAGQELIQPVQHAKQVSAPNGVQRLPGGKDDQRYSQPAQGFDLAGGCPDALVIIQDIIQTTHTTDGSTRAGSHIFIQRNVNAGGIGSGGVFANRAQVQARAGAGKEPVQHNCQHNGRISQKAVREKHLAHNAKAGKHRNHGTECFISQRCRGVAGTVQDKHTKKVCHTHAKGGQRKAGHVLVCTQGDGQEGVNQTAQGGCDQGAQQGQNYADKGAGVGAEFFVIISAGKTGKAAQVHDTGNTQVQVARFFRQGLAQSAVHNDSAKRDGTQDPCNQTAHTYLPSLPS